MSRLCYLPPLPPPPSPPPSPATSSDPPLTSPPRAITHFVFVIVTDYMQGTLLYWAETLYNVVMVTFVCMVTLM